QRGLFEYQRQGWKAALADFDRAFELGLPKLRGDGAWLLWYYRALARLHLGHVKQGAADLKEAAASPLASLNALRHHALVCAAQGDAAGYRAACARLLAQSNEGFYPVDVNNRAWACVLAPAGPDTAPAAAAMVRTVLVNYPGNKHAPLNT